MKKTRLFWVAVLACTIGVSHGEGFAYRNPTDFSRWEQLRTTLQHPCGIYRQEDIDRVRKRIEVDAEAQGIARSVIRRADNILTEIILQTL